jgi:hypothetical protein
MQWTHLHYVLIEKPALGGQTCMHRVAQLVQPFMTRARTWRGWVRRILTTVLVNNAQEIPMPDTDVTTVAPAVIGKMLLAQLDSASAEALRAAVAEDILESVKAQALEAAMADLDEAHRIVGPLALERYEHLGAVGIRRDALEPVGPLLLGNRIGQLDFFGHRPVGIEANQ